MPDHHLDPELWEFWGTRPKLTLREAAWLIFNILPPPLSAREPVLAHISHTMSALKEDLPPEIEMRDPRGLDAWRDDNFTLQPVNTRNHVTRDEGIAWCEANHLKPAMWFPESRPGRSKGRDVKDYRTKLLDIAYAVVREFWLDAPTVKPSRDCVVAWLRVEYPEISEAEAMAVDKITRPDQYRRTQLK